MTLHVLSNYTPADATYVNDMSNEILTASLLNTIRTLIDRTVSFSAGYLDCFADVYIDSNGRENSVNNASAVFDTNKYKAVTSTTEPYVIIEATSIADVNDWDINNCDLVKIDTGKWLLSCSTGTDEVKRAQIYKTLFYGTDGTNPRASSTYITGITALKTNVARDVGKRAHYAQLFAGFGSYGSDMHSYGYYTGTFTDTTNNTDCSSWSKVAYSGDGSEVAFCSKWEMPSGTVLLSHTTGDDPTSTNEIGTDLTADELNNPATCQLECSGSRDDNDRSGGTTRTIILCSGDITWAYTYGNTDTGVYSNIDFYSDNSIPVFTAVTEDFESLIYHTIPTGRFPATVSSAICVPLIKDWETGADIQFKLTNATEDSGWLEVMGTTSGKPAVQTFTAFTSEPTSLIVKLIPKTSSPTPGYPSILGVGCIAN